MTIKYRTLAIWKMFFDISSNWELLLSHYLKAFKPGTSQPETFTFFPTVVLYMPPWKIVIVKWFVRFHLVVVFLDQIAILLKKMHFFNSNYTHPYNLSLKSQFAHLVYVKSNLGPVTAHNKRRELMMSQL